MCGEGIRPMLDCRGALQQFARDLKADLSYMSQAQIGLALTTTKLSEADALSSDLIQHYYQTCTLYNACILSRQEYAVKTENLQGIQLEVRRALASIAVAAQQNIAINPPGGMPPGFPGPSLPPSFPAPAPGFPPPGGRFPPSGGAPSTSPSPAGGSMGNPSATPKVDAILDILRDGSKGFRSTAGGPGGPPAPIQGDLEASLRGLLTTIRQDVARQRPTLSQARAVVGNFTEDGKPWSSPLGAMLQERVSSIVEADRLFQPPRQTRGITIKEVGSVSNPNDPKALGALYGSDIAIVGTYRPQADRVWLQLVALDANGVEVAKAQKDIPGTAIPNVLPTAPSNAADTGQLLGSLGQLGPRAQGIAGVQVTTNRPGVGANFRLGEEIRYFVTPTTGGYLYLFHIDGSNHVTRLFPNDYQREARVSAGTTLSVPADDAPFKFEASPPFALETTFAIITPAPLSDLDIRMVVQGLGQPDTRQSTLRSLRDMAGDAPMTPSSGRAGRIVWSSVTVLIRP